jgi:hypothetical protein
MKIIYKITFIILLTWTISGCEDVVEVDLPEAEPVLVVDAWLTDQLHEQVIRLTRTQPYFDSSLPNGVSGAEIKIFRDDLVVLEFNEEGNNGEYIWKPQGNPIGSVGDNFMLEIKLGTATYRSVSRMNRVPEIDSISFRFEEGNSFFPDAYFAGVFARDFEGPGDSYWIKAYKNGQLLNKPSEINLAFDAGFTQGGSVDGIVFIQPIRDGINPFDEDENEEIKPPYEPGDSVFVEIHSITNEAFTFLNELSIQTDRPGGFAELFAQPLANIPTNITMEESSSGLPVIGFFNMAAVSSAGKQLDPENLPE